MHVFPFSIDKCQDTEAVLNANSSDIRVSPNFNDRAPLQGSGVATIPEEDRLEVFIDGRTVVTETVRFWITFATKVTVTLYPAQGVGNQLDVSFDF